MRGRHQFAQRLRPLGPFLRAGENVCILQRLGAADLDHDIHQVLDQHRRIRALLQQRRRLVQRGLVVCGDDPIHQVEHARAIREAQHVAQLLGADFPAFTLHDGLIQDGQSVARRSLRGARNQRQRLAGNLGALLSGNIPQMLGQRFGGEALQVETLAARQHRHRHLADFRRREDELHMRRRFFQRLEQRVERRRRQHVNFVDDVDLVARAHRRIPRPIQQVAHIRHARVRRRIELQHVRMRSRHDRRAMHARRVQYHRRLVHIPGFVIQRPRQQSRRGGLPHPAHAGQHEGVSDPPGLERVGQRPDHRLLPDQVLEPRRPVFARQHLIGRRRQRRVIPEHGCGQRVARFRDIVLRPVFGRFRGLLPCHGDYMAQPNRNRQLAYGNPQILLWND